MKTIIVLISVLLFYSVVSAQTFSTGSPTNTIPGNLLVTGTAQFNTTLSLTNDVKLERDAANTLGVRNGANAQTLNLYSTYTNPTDYERLRISSASGAEFRITTEKAGSGTLRSLQFDSASYAWRLDGTLAWLLQSTGHIVPVTDNVYDIGVGGGNSIRRIYVGTSILLGTNVLSFSGTNLTWNGVAITVP